MEGPPWMIIHTLGNMMKEIEYVNMKKSFNVATKKAFALVGSQLYYLMRKYYHLKLEEIETLLAMTDLNCFQGKYNDSQGRS